MEEYLESKNISEWRQWLKSNYNKSNGIKLVFYRKASNKYSLSYEEAVEEALCWGWIDSIVNKIDDTKYTRKFTPRKPKSNWSELNKKRINKLLDEGRIEEPGLDVINKAKKDGSFEKVIKIPKIDKNISSQFSEALSKNKSASNFYKSLSKSEQTNFNIWINSAKREETKSKRIDESITLLKNKKLLGLK